MLRLRTLNNEAHMAWRKDFDTTQKVAKRIIRKCVKAHGWTVVRLSITQAICLVEIEGKETSYDAKNVSSLCEAFDYLMHAELSPEGNKRNASNEYKLFDKKIAILGTRIKTGN